MQNKLGKAFVMALLALSGVASAASLDEVAGMIRSGEYQNALEQLAQLPDSPTMRLMRADALTGMKRHREAEALYRTLINEAPQDPTPYNNLATLYAAEGRLQEASELLNQGMKSDARYAAIYHNLSRVYVEMSRSSYAKALRLSEQPQGLQLTMLTQADAIGAIAQRPASEVARPVAVAQATSATPATEKPAAGATGQTPAVAMDTVAPASRVQQAAAGGFDGGGVIAALNQWAAAWSGQDVDGYLAAYDVDFLPPRDLSRSQWQAERRVRLRKPGKIEVRLSDFEVSSTGGNNALTVKLVQHYRSDSYRDTTRKGFIMVQRDGVWKIGVEYTIEVIK